MSALQFSIQRGMPVKVEIWGVGFHLHVLPPLQVASCSCCVPRTASVQQPEATSESNVRWAGRRRTSRWGSHPAAGSPTVRTGSSGDRDWAETRDGKGAGVRAMGLGPLNHHTGGPGRPWHLLSPPGKPSVNNTPHSGHYFPLCQLPAACLWHHLT